MKKYFRALTIAGSDSGGGAGIQADLKTFSALGCYGMSAIAALTAQNTHEVRAIFPVDPAFLADQIDAVMEDIGTDAVKIGMLHSPEVILTAADRLTHHKAGNIVVDPVMISKSGAKLLKDDAVEALKTGLLPLAAVLTPNLPEASVLLGRPVERQEDMREACIDLAKLGPKAVLLKGGHLTEAESPDLLYISEGEQWLTLDAERIDTRNTHGTGCTLSSAVAAFLARGFSLQEAVVSAKEYISSALKAGREYTIGQGHGPVHHFYRLWKEGGLL